MKFYLPAVILLISLTLTNPIYAQTVLAPGAQPQLTVGDKGIVRLVFGQKDKILYSTSNDNGKTFSNPVVIADVARMHLGMTRGPQLATSRDYSIVTAMDQNGNIHSFRLTHKTGKWERMQNVNDVDGSAPEGLMSIAADANNNFYAVWLDLRENRKNNIAFASMRGNSKWTKNVFAYKSSEDHVCECCKPSIVVKENNVAIMFRNWLKGSRDLYLVTSANAGQKFSEAQKLGKGTWPLKGCPMDGGGMSIDSKNNIHTVWQRDGQIFYAQPGQEEEKIGEGRHTGLTGGFATWESGNNLIAKRLTGAQQKIGEGTALTICELSDKSNLAIWENDNQILFKKF